MMEQRWPEAMATVTACRYQVATGRALAFGLPSMRHFHITFNYWAPNADNIDELHTGELTSEKAMHVGTLFPIRYNPEAPYQTIQSDTEPLPSNDAPMTTRNPLLIIGILGSVVLSLVWLLILRRSR